MIFCSAPGCQTTAGCICSRVGRSFGTPVDTSPEIERLTRIVADTLKSASNTFDAYKTMEARALAAESRTLTIEAETREALQPFADFIKGSHMPDDFVITMGSGFARRQLTAGDCKRAATAIRAAGKEQP